MKFCYADESCDDRGETIQVMVGIVADAQRLNRSRVEFSEIFALVEGAYPEALKELKGSRIFYGRGGWRDVPPEIRKAVFRLFCEWIGERKHSLALSAIDIGRFNARLPDNYPIRSAICGSRARCTSPFNFRSFTRPSRRTRGTRFSYSTRTR